jgi:hypothetical protein
MQEVKFAILRKNLKKTDPIKVGRILAQVTQMSQVDAIGLASRSRGILIDNLSKHQAQKIRELLKQQSTDVFIIKHEDMYYPNPLFITRNADCLENHLAITINAYGHIKKITWEHILLISVGRVNTMDITREYESLAGKLYSPARVAAPEKVDIKRECDVDLVDIFITDPNQHFRIIAQEFNYDYLGKRLQYSVQNNFHALVNDLTRYATKAYRNKGVEEFLAKGSLKISTYREITEFDMENFWLLQLISLGKK